MVACRKERVLPAFAFGKNQLSVAGAIARTAACLQCSKQCFSTAKRQRWLPAIKDVGLSQTQSCLQLLVAAMPRRHRVKRRRDGPKRCAEGLFSSC